MKSSTAEMLSSVHSVETEYHTKTTSNTDHASCSSTMKQTNTKGELRHFASTESVGSTAHAKSRSGTKLNSTAGPPPIDEPSIKSCCTKLDVTSVTEQENEERNLSSPTKPVDKSCTSKTSSQPHNTSGVSVSPPANDAIATCDSQTYSPEQPSSNSQDSTGATEEEVCSKQLCGTAALAAQQMSTMSVLNLTSNMEFSNSNVSTERTCGADELASTGNKVRSSNRSTCDVTAELNSKRVTDPCSSVASVKPLASSLNDSIHRATNSQPLSNSSKFSVHDSSSRPHMNFPTLKEEATNPLEQVPMKTIAAVTGGCVAVAPVSLREKNPNINSDCKTSSIKSYQLNTSKTVTHGFTTKAQQLQSVTTKVGQTKTAQPNPPDTTSCLQRRVPVDVAVCETSKKLESLRIATEGPKTAPLSAKVSTPKVHSEDVSLKNVHDGTVTSVTPYSRRESTC